MVRGLFVLGFNEHVLFKIAGARGRAFHELPGDNMPGDPCFAEGIVSRLRLFGVAKERMATTLPLCMTKRISPSEFLKNNC